MFLGIDIGGHGIKAGLLKGKEISEKKQLPIKGDENTSEFVNTLKSFISNYTTHNLKGIGIGVPGLVNPETGIIYDIQNIPLLKEIHLKHTLETKFKLPVFINNDANCFALGENYFGFGTQYKNFLGVTLGTGLGTGIIIENRLYAGSYCGAGEIGMLPYKDGILENYTGSLFFKKNQTTGVLTYNKALKNDTNAKTLFNEFGKHLGEAVHIMLHAYAPEAIVFGGAIAKAYPFFKTTLHKKIALFPFKRQISEFKIHVSEKTDMGILGAAALCLQH